MSTSAVSAAAPAPTSPSAQPRGSRPPNPRPTTYSGALPSVPTSASNATGSNGPPIPPPTRTSSKNQVPTSSSTTGTRDNSRSNGGGDGQYDRERDRDRERRKAEDQRSRQTELPVGRSNSSRAPNTQGANSRDPSDAGRRASEAGPARTRASMASGSDATRRSTRKETRFGEYILGQTLGEGEFGKVKLGWRRDGGVQVAIKLIRRDTVTPHPNRLSKIYREIAILRTLSHPNIVRLHEMVETDRHIGIILEYASGGELFDYILTHRYLKDPPACRLFAQLVSGVGYLHKKGIVHRDLKLENLLLDRNRNIIITDFGFANVFDPNDELGELEDQLDNPEVLKELESIAMAAAGKNTDESGSLLSILGPGQPRRRGDLMATSCGSPCYAAPELVVSDGLYTGRKVDVWSCGVILYAMLAGYLPFDDDPANPEGDNINLLYKYIVSTPLTFPEYVTPHARDLLRRILVPDPRRRADLFEVARHSWLSPFADIVNKVTSATTGIKDVETVTITEPKPEGPVLNRSHSVREPSSTSHHHTPAALGPRHHEQLVAPTQPKPSADNKRRTVQVEYVEPQSQTKRGSSVEQSNNEADEAAPPPVVSTHKDTGVTRAATSAGTSRAPYANKVSARAREGHEQLPVPEKGKTRPVSYAYQASTSRSSGNTNGDGTPARRGSTREPRDGKSASNAGGDTGRPTTATSVASTRLPSRGSYSQPVAPSIASNTAQGRIAQPSAAGTIASGAIIGASGASKANKTLHISAPIPQTDGHAGTDVLNPEPPKGHKRANTVAGSGVDSSRFLGKIMGGSSEKEKESKQPPLSRPGFLAQASVGTPSARQSLDQGPRKIDPKTGAPKSRRFSLLPTSFSLRTLTSEGKHERKLSRSNSRANGTFQEQPQVQSQPHIGQGLGIGQQDAASLSASDTSIAVGSAPASAMGQREEPQQGKKGTLSKHKKFGDAYEVEGSSGGHGSSGPARRVMDFFRRRGNARIKGEKS
ncbi:hypothetical protein BZA77DRAFT_318245 [Pyronema omphalodes]|nr:hypothetical protein BZA77DRAFT_318245 [Pyronema omphalodes]